MAKPAGVRHRRTGGPTPSQLFFLLIVVGVILMAVNQLRSSLMVRRAAYVSAQQRIQLLLKSTNASESAQTKALHKLVSQLQSQRQGTKFDQVNGEEASQAVANPEKICHAEEYAEYSGELVKSGEGHVQPSAAACCKACQAEPGCNVWVWCGEAGGCGSGQGARAHGECWLKHQALEDVLQLEAGFRTSPNVKWVSGVVYSEEEGKAYEARQAAKAKDHEAWLESLKADPDLPWVWMDVAIYDMHVGRIEAVLLAKDAPLAAENMRLLCTGEAGVAPKGHEGEGKPYTLKGASFYRIIDGFIDQTGGPTDSPLGGEFADEPGALALKHDRKGLLSLANAGPNTNGGHFSILMGPAPHLNGHYGIFGVVISGLEVVDSINALSREKLGPGGELLDSKAAVITNVGQMRMGRLFDKSLLKGKVFFPPVSWSQGEAQGDVGAG